ncbi:hypothetical protein FBU59_006480, partial [Linderina macrospora]
PQSNQFQSQQQQTAQFQQQMRQMQPQPQQFQNIQQTTTVQRQFTGLSSGSTANLMTPSQSITSNPAASSSTTGLIPPNPAGMFMNQGLTGSTPNLGSFANKPPVSSMAGFSNITATAGQGFNQPQQMNQFNQFSTLQQRPMQTTTSPLGNQSMNSSFGHSMSHSISGQMGGQTITQNKYDMFKNVNPHAPSVFSAASQPMQTSNVATSQFSTTTMTMGGMNSSQPMGGSRPAGPTGVFAMANPTVNQQQQQQPNMFQNQMVNPQQQQLQLQQQQLQQQQLQQQQLQQQQMFNQGMNNAGGFGTQWR